MPDRITLAMVTDALKLAGIEATETERQAMVNGANQALARYEAIRQTDIPNDVSLSAGGVEAYVVSSASQ